MSPGAAHEPGGGVPGEVQGGVEAVLSGGGEEGGQLVSRP